jgi:hypothetical protein
MSGVDDWEFAQYPKDERVTDTPSPLGLESAARTLEQCGFAHLAPHVRMAAATIAELRERLDALRREA